MAPTARTRCRGDVWTVSWPRPCPLLRPTVCRCGSKHRAPPWAPGCAWLLQHGCAGLAQTCLLPTRPACLHPWTSRPACVVEQNRWEGVGQPGRRAGFLMEKAAVLVTPEVQLRTHWGRGCTCTSLRPKLHSQPMDTCPGQHAGPITPCSFFYFKMWSFPLHLLGEAIPTAAGEVS